MMRYNTIKKLLLACTCCTMLSAAVAQSEYGSPNGFNMPFSQFGIGSSELPFNMPLVNRMGGTVYTLGGNNYVNPFNPASYGFIQSESFVFDMGVNIQLSTLRDNNNSVNDADGNLGYLMVAMPVTKWWKLAGGLMPYSTVDYESTSTQTGAGFGKMNTVYYGNGGVNDVFLGSAFNIMRGDAKRPLLQAGFNVHYLTGNIDRTISYAFLGTDTSHYLPGRRYKHTDVSNFTVDFGVQMRQPLGERYTLGLGVVYKPHMKMKVDDEALIYTYHVSDESLVDTIFPALGVDAGFKSDLERASTVGVGLSLERNKKWQVAVDATFAEWNDMKYTEGKTPSIFGDSRHVYGPYSRYAVGFERMGDMDASTYWGRISWSLGAHLEQGCLCLRLDGGNEQRLDEWGLGIGATLPLRKGRSLLTISAAYSSFGTPDVLQRNTVTFGIAVSSCERCFVKRKYN